MSHLYRLRIAPTRFCCASSSHPSPQICQSAPAPPTTAAIFAATVALEVVATTSEGDSKS